MLYALGFPRGDEFMIAQPGGQMWLWTSMADALEEQDPSYFENFWTKPGYVGFDHPELVAHDVINTRATVSRLLTATDILEDPRFLQPEFQNMRIWVPIMAAHANSAYDVPMVAELEGIEGGYPLGSGVRVLTGRAAGRQLYAQQAVGNVFFCDGEGDANLLRFTDVLPGDEVQVDNRKFLAYHYFASHHLMEDIQFDALQSALMGVGYSGQYNEKLIWVHHTHDSSLWPPQGIIYRDAVRGAQGEAGARERFRLRWIENAEHGPAIMMPSQPNRASHTWLIDYMPFIEQSIKDLIDWVEQGIEPAETVFDFRDNRVVLSRDATERQGIQATIAVSANDAIRAEVAVGEPVTLELRATVPPGAGTIVEAEWDFDGHGSFPFKHPEVDGTAASVTLTTTHTFDHPGEYFVTGRVHSHREGDITSTSRRIANVAQARVVVS
jgi:hypothetical protein